MKSYAEQLAEFDALIAADDAELDLLRKRRNENIELRRILVNERADAMTDDEILADMDLLQDLLHDYMYRAGGSPRFDRMVPARYHRPVFCSGTSHVDRATRRPVGHGIDKVTPENADPILLPYFELMIDKDTDLDAAAAEISALAEKWRFGRDVIPFSVFEHTLSENGKVLFTYRSDTDCTVGLRYVTTTGTLRECLTEVQRTWYYE